MTERKTDKITVKLNPESVDFLTNLKHRNHFRSYDEVINWLSSNFPNLSNLSIDENKDTHITNITKDDSSKEPESDSNITNKSQNTNFSNMSKNDTIEDNNNTQITKYTKNMSNHPIINHALGATFIDILKDAKRSNIDELLLVKIMDAYSREYRKIDIQATLEELVSQNKILISNGLRYSGGVADGGRCGFDSVFNE